MLGIFSEFERVMICDRVMAGLHRARYVNGKRLRRLRLSPFRIDTIKRALAEGSGVRETARLLKVSAAKVSEVRRGMILPAPAEGDEGVSVR